jgi:hypothetical protein
MVDFFQNQVLCFVVTLTLPSPASGRGDDVKLRYKFMTSYAAILQQLNLSTANTAFMQRQKAATDALNQTHFAEQLEAVLLNMQQQTKCSGSPSQMKEVAGQFALAVSSTVGMSPSEYDNNGAASEFARAGAFMMNVIQDSSLLGVVDKLSDTLLKMSGAMRAQDDDDDEDMRDAISDTMSGLPASLKSAMTDDDSDLADSSTATATSSADDARSTSHIPAIIP